MPTDKNIDNFLSEYAKQVTALAACTTVHELQRASELLHDLVAQEVSRLSKMSRYRIYPSRAVARLVKGAWSKPQVLRFDTYAEPFSVSLLALTHSTPTLRSTWAELADALHQYRKTIVNTQASNLHAARRMADTLNATQFCFTQKNTIEEVKPLFDAEHGKDRFVFQFPRYPGALQCFFQTLAAQQSPGNAKAWSQAWCAKFQSLLATRLTKALEKKSAQNRDKTVTLSDIYYSASSDIKTTIKALCTLKASAQLPVVRRAGEDLGSDFDL